MSTKCSVKTRIKRIQNHPARVERLHALYNTIKQDIDIKWGAFNTFYEWALSNGYSCNTTCKLLKLDETKPFSEKNCIIVSTFTGTSQLSNIISIYKMRVAEKTLSDIAEVYNVTRERIRQIIIDYNLDVRPKSERIKEIASIVGCSRGIIYTHLSGSCKNKKYGAAIDAAVVAVNNKN